MVVAPNGTSSTKSAQRARYYVVAPVGHPNYGDELIAASWLRELAETAPDAER